MTESRADAERRRRSRGAEPATSAVARATPRGRRGRGEDAGETTTAAQRPWRRRRVAARAADAAASQAAAPRPTPARAGGPPSSDGAEPAERVRGAPTPASRAGASAPQSRARPSRTRLRADVRVARRPGRASSRLQSIGSRALGPRFPRLRLMSYAIISVGGKQYRVREGEGCSSTGCARRGQDVHAAVLLVGGDGETQIVAEGRHVTARVVGTSRARRSGSASTAEERATSHTGFRASLSQIEIESIGAQEARRGAAEDRGRRRSRAEAAAPRRPPRSASRACRAATRS